METKQTSLFPKSLLAVLALLYVLSLAWLLYGNIQAGDSQPWQLLVSGLILSISLILLYGSIGVIVVAFRQKKQGPLDQRLAKIIYWTPRLAGLGIIFFVSLFSLDVFGQGGAFGEVMLAFLMHMIPSLILFAALALAWRWEWVGCALFVVAGLFFLRQLLHDPLQGLGMFLLFSGPMFAVALLFGLNWLWKKDLQNSRLDKTSGAA